MKQKIHIPYLLETSLRVAEPFNKFKTGFEKSSTHFQIPKLLNSRILLMLLFFLWGLGGYAQQTQPYEWQWAIKGGGGQGGTGANIDDEQIYDIKVGTDNNYYILATIKGNVQTNIDNDYNITVYNAVGNSSSSQDILLFSTTCDGEVRWSQAIGGGGSDRAYNLVLDSEDNVYIGGHFSPGVTNSAGTFPVHFSPTDSLPSSGSNNVVSDYHKRIFLVKYDKDGNYQGKKALQGDVDVYNSGSQILDLAISNDTLHFIVGLQQGTHLDGQVTVPSTVTIQYHLAKYDTNLNYISSMTLPVADGTGFPTGTTRFAYDASKNQYYIAGMRGNVTGAVQPLKYDGRSFVERSFILAFDDSDGSENWRREIYTEPVNGSLASNGIYSLIIDENSDVYVGGRIWRSFNDNTAAKVYDPNGTYTYSFTPTPYTILPTVIRFSSNGAVEWVKTPTDFAPNYSSNTALRPKGLAFNGNEIGFGSGESYFEWDNFTQGYSQYQKPDPTLLRFDKQSGMTLGMHSIPGDFNTNQFMTAVAVDNDGNYITGGAFEINLLQNNSLGLSPLFSTGEADFFVAKLANSACGSGLSTENFNSLSFNIYPNPTTGIINVETTEQLSTYRIYDATGRLIGENRFDGNNQVNLENTSNGVYFIIITTVEGKAGTVKVVKR